MLQELRLDVVSKQTSNVPVDSLMQDLPFLLDLLV
jgi:hypothetical protein